jgi:uncharacterized damage-inducible protein DinB
MRVDTRIARRFLRTLLMLVLAPVAVALAQDNPPPAAAAPSKDPYTTHVKGLYAGLKGLLLRTAEKMPEENYGFRPTEEVRSFGQILGHVADSQYFFCSQVRGEKHPALKIEATKTSKAALTTALNDAFAYCDKAYEGMTDASAVEMVKHMGRDTPKLGTLITNNVHSVEHYGNIVTYLRMKNIVPPTSEPEFMKEMMKN